MNIMNKVTLQSMKKNKTRTIVTIVGIILSVSMVTAVTTIVTSLQNYLYESAVYENGSWHGMFQNISFLTNRNNIVITFRIAFML